MMHNTRYLRKNFEQRRLEKTISRHFPYNLTCVPDGLPSFKMAGKTTNALMTKFSVSVNCKMTSTST